MDKTEAKRVLQSELEKYRQRSYESLRKLIDDLDAYTVRGPSGTEYQIEVQAMWDNHPEGNLRVMAGIDDGGLLSAFAPVTDDFILSPGGEFVDEF
jgi:hypothetical protein